MPVSPSGPQLRIRMFGGFEVTIGADAARFETRKAAALLAFLAYFPERGHDRDTLVETLWPDSDPDAGRDRLRQTLARLRRSLGNAGSPGAGHTILPGRAELRLAAGACVTDVVGFRAAAARAAAATDSGARHSALEEAASLCTGPLLPGFDERWIMPERVSLDEARYDVLRRLARARAAAGDSSGAIVAARTAIEVDPLREGARYDLIRLYASTNRPADALKQYAEFERVLAQELSVRPSHRMRDLAAQISSGDPLPRAAPAAGAPPPKDRPGLPAPRTRFFGRESELDRLTLLLLGESARGAPAPPMDERWAARIVTLTGTGGCGKTRLALELARRVDAQAGRAAYFVRLEDVHDSGGILAAIMDAVGAGRKPGDAPRARTVEALRQRPVLLVLDNFEHLVDVGAALVGTLLDQVPGLACLVTTRRRLDIEGERECPVRPLVAPDSDASPRHLLECPSVQLFVDRAQAANPAFELTAANSDAVAAICRKVDGIPLAVELVAAQADVLAAPQMVAFLESGRWPANRLRDVPARHASLDAAIDGSYGLLSPDQRRLFRRLSVFTGGWHPEAAAAVCMGGVGEAEAVDRLEELRARSLVYTEEANGLARFHMLQTLRYYARSRTSEDEWADLSEHHAAYFLAMAEGAAPRLRGPDQCLWLSRLRLEEPNLLAALDTCSVCCGDAEEREIRLAAAIYLLWWVDRRAAQGLERVTGALARHDPRRKTRSRAAALFAAARLAYQAERPDAEQFAIEGLSISEELGWKYGRAVGLNALGAVYFRKHDRAAAAEFQKRAVAAARALDDPILIATALNGLAIARDTGAEPLFEESLAFWRRAGDRIGLAGPLFHLGGRAAAAGDYATARRYHEEQAKVAADVGDYVGAAHALALLGQDLHALGETREARARLEESLTLRRRLRDSLDVAHSQCLLADVLADTGDAVNADLYYRESIPVALEKDAPWLTCHALAGLAALSARARNYDAAAAFASVALGMAPGTTPHAWLVQRTEHALRESEQFLGRPAFEAICRTAASMRPLGLLAWSRRPDRSPAGAPEQATDTPARFPAKRRS